MRFVAFALLLVAGCPDAEVLPDPSTVSATASASASASTASASATASATAASPAPSSTATVAPSARSGAIEMPPIVDPGGNPLPQTEDEPTIDDPVFVDRAKRLWQAIVVDDPELVRDFFFPVEAYAKVKAIKRPERDWKYRLWKNFVRDIHDYHKRLGKKRAEAEFVNIELRNKVAWMKPGKEGNLIGYHRVTRSYIHYKNADGKKRRIDLTSMISWRGHWYIVHLHGFK